MLALTDIFLGETIPIRLFLGGFDLTPTFREVNKKFSTRYYLSLVLIDEGESAFASSLLRFRIHMLHISFSRFMTAGWHLHFGNWVGEEQTPRAPT